MTPMQTVYELEEVLHKIDACTNFCYEVDIDYSFLAIAQEALTSQIDGIKQTLAYKMEQYEAYGEPLDEIGIEGLRMSIEEVGYEQMLSLFGDSVDAALSEAAAEEESYRV